MGDQNIDQSRQQSKGGMVASAFRPMVKNTLQGFFDLTLQSGITIKECSWHRSETGDKEWVGLPGRAQIDKSGVARKDANGKILYSPAVTIDDRTRRDKFNSQALAALAALISNGA